MHNLPVKECQYAPEAFIFRGSLNLSNFITFCVFGRFYAVPAKSPAESALESFSVLGLRGFFARSGGRGAGVSGRGRLSENNLFAGNLAGLWHFFSV